MLSRYFVKGSGIVVCFALFFSVFAGDMSLTLEDGEEVVLHSDGTWSYTRRGASAGNEDQYITLSDTRILCLQANYKWKFVREMPQTRRLQSYPEVIAVGSASHSNLDQAVNQAKEGAVNRAADRLQEFAPSSLDNSKQLLAACILREHGEVGEVQFEPSWEAEARITLSPRIVRRVIECLEDQIPSDDEDEE
ncbi:hypothetical protein QA601_01050 [Chitinispirillales bacterium ANBcel5]|uniref:hypothetical protein n=1 Tax=Cellulosispirillum alkaliphilum TaxID=3039283 RepID=UPI002A53278E|nr:hypothetical protein [Chitinispirillales bacterium ANBcel5]